ncbi:MAG: copper homeostasis protein CutC [Propioniciclava sp.]
MSGTVEVGILSARDASPAADGGADRLHLVRRTQAGPMAPELREVAAVRARTDLPLRVTVRLREGFSTDGGEVVRLRGLVGAYLDAGADGVVLGFLNGLGAIDREVIATVLAESACGWTFSRAIDTCLEVDLAWSVLLGLPRLEGVQTAGSARTLEHGLDDLLRRARSTPAAAALMIADGQLRPEQVPWLVRAGVSQFHLDDQVRPGGSERAYVDERLVGSWRRLIDAESGRTER